MALSSRKQVLRRLTEVFPNPVEAGEALQSLERYGIGDAEPAVEAVQLAVLKLCDGKLWRLRELVHSAKHDFRDVLYPAQADLAAWHLWLTPPAL